MTDEIAKRDSEALAPVEAQSMAKLLELAIDKNVDVASLEKLVDLSDRIADRAARQEFAVALADFQQNCPPIPRESKAVIKDRSTGQIKYTYSYAELDTIARMVNPLLGERHLSYGWDTDVAEGMIVCTCTVRHSNGHSESSRFACPIDESRQMTPQQRYSSTVTVAKRQSLIAVLGLTATDPDTDGAPATDTITDDQVASLEALISEVKADLGKLLAYAGVEELDQIRQSDYRRIVGMLERKRK